ncbi:hypothetical protein CYK37_04580 [Mesorhizobium loti]|nr:hypothetical protein CYK37_04580 [Mesorhizobium loti]
MLSGSPLPARYFQLYRIRFAFDWPAFASVLAIFWLMLRHPRPHCFDRDRAR